MEKECCLIAMASDRRICPVCGNIFSLRPEPSAAPEAAVEPSVKQAVDPKWKPQPYEEIVGLRILLTAAEQEVDRLTRGGCGLPGHTTVTADEGTCYCLTCEMISQRNALQAENERLIRVGYRLCSGNVYPKWEHSGGGEECPHGINVAIPCSRCDMLTIQKAAESIGIIGEATCALADSAKEGKQP